MKSTIRGVCGLIWLFLLTAVQAQDVTPPTLLDRNPPPQSTVVSLTLINCTFSEAVTGVNASDLWINGSPAASLGSNNVNDYTFYFSQPGAGPVQVVFAPGHGIKDIAGNPFAGDNWTFILDTNTPAPAVVISEFMAANANGLRDDDYEHNDWLELYNAGSLPVNLEGWFLTDTPNLPKWRLPAVLLAGNNYLLIWCSDKNRNSANAPLHTNFKISKDAGGYLALLDSNTNVVSAFVNYPAQATDVSFGRDKFDPSLTGYLTAPTPGAQNPTIGAGILGAPLISAASGLYTNASVVVTMSNTNSSGVIRFTFDGTVPTSASPVYTGPVTLTANRILKARVFGAAGVLPSAVTARNYIFIADTAKNFSSRLPVVVISTVEGRPLLSSVPPGSPRTKGALAVITPAGGRSSLTGKADVQELAEYETFGQTSEAFAKQPIRIEIQDSAGNDLDVGLLGMPADADWQLRNPFNDKSYLNDFLGLELWEKMGHYSVRRKFVEVFLDTGGGSVTYPADYYGVMLLCESIKVTKSRVDVPALTPFATNEPAITGGYIVKRDKDSMGDLNFTTPGGFGFPGIPLKLHEPRPNQMRLTQGVTTSYPGAGGYTPAGTSQMNYLINYLGLMERALYTNTWLTQTGTNHYSHYLDTVAFADQFLHVELTKNIDGYRLSTFFTKDRNGKFGPGPVWDWDLAFGNADYNQGGITNTWYFELTGAVDEPWARRLISGTVGAPGNSGDPDFLQLIADRWGMFRTNVLNATNVMRQIDEYASLLSESAARDLYGKYRLSVVGIDMWPNPDGTADGRDVDYAHPTNYFGPLEMKAPSTASGSIIGQMKKWLLGRYLWMDNQFATPPALSASGGMVTNGFEVMITSPAGTTLYYTLDGSDPRLPGGAVSVSALSNSGPVTVAVNSNIRIVARTRRPGTFKNSWSGPAAASYFTAIPPLRITEIMYHPAPPPLGSTNSASDFEYIEVKNISPLPLPVGGFTLSGGIQFGFPSATLAAGESAVIVANASAFQARYSTGPRILGAFAGHLNDAGDCLSLSGRLGEGILDFCYSDQWMPATDGAGFSLVVNNDLAAPEAWATAAQWRASSAVGGSPTENDPLPSPRPPVLVNEIRAQSSLPEGDAIELYNPTGAPANIGGWFLTDDIDVPNKYVIPANTIIGPNGYIALTAAGNFGAEFGLNASGDEVYLFSGNGAELTGYAHGFQFGASASGSTIGRHVISTGSEHFVAQTSPTFGAANAGPLVGPIVIDEIQYHPPDYGVDFHNTADEFIELRNLSSNAIALQESGAPWQLSGSISFLFPLGVEMPPGGKILVVGFDPSDAEALQNFRDRNGAPGDFPVYGPWTGSLDDNSGNVEIKRPDTAPNDGSRYILVERVTYSSGAPWPAGAAGLGLSLQRIVGESYGNDPTNWAAAMPAPGAVFSASGVPPAIISQPGNMLLPFGTNVTLSITATGTAPLRYQWRLNGVNLPGETNATLSDQNFQFEDAGVYSVLSLNGAGYAVSTNFTVSGRYDLVIMTQPITRNALVGTTTNLTVEAVGDGPLRYQWLFNGSPIPGATGSTLWITNIQPEDGGSYMVLVSDLYITVPSETAVLTPVTRPVRTLQPFNMTVVEGTDVAMSAAAEGTLPISFRWRTNGTTISNIVYVVSTPSNSTLVITNISTNFTGLRFTVAITNIGGNGPLTTNAVLTVLPDTDRDGLPDEWEAGRPGFNPTDPADGVRDDDGDAMTNSQEYYAGTDPFDPSSRLGALITSIDPVVISFLAVSNRAYSVQYSDRLGMPWSTLGYALSEPETRQEGVIDLMTKTNRFYRLVTPPQR